MAPQMERPKNSMQFHASPPPQSDAHLQKPKQVSSHPHNHGHHHHDHQRPYRCWKQTYANLNYFMIYYVSVVHIGAAIGVMCIPEAKRATLLLMPVFYALSTMGITAGCHRLWSHRSYKAHWTVRFALMLCTSLANQGTIFHWCRDHRVHHKYSDKEADPHDSGRGFFFAHMGWLLVKKDPKVLEAGNKLNYDDLLSDWVVRLQQKFNPWGQLFMCFVAPTLATMYLCDETWLNALCINGFLRYVLVLHATWLVNSAAHFYGYQPYDAAIPPRENLLVSIGAVGEGWHNWHHKFPYDYAASEFGAHRQFNPTKMLIDMWAAMGLVTDRKRATTLWEKMQERRAKQASADVASDVVKDSDDTRAFSTLKAKAV